MAVDSHIITEQYLNGTWQFHSHYDTQDTKAYCALSAIYKAAKALNFISYEEITEEAFELLEGYGLEKEDLDTISLVNFFNVIHQLDPHDTTQANPLIATIAAKYQEEEHLQCIGIIKDLCAPLWQIKHLENHRVILFWGY